MTARGKLVFTLIIFAIVLVGAWRWKSKLSTGTETSSTSNTAQTADATGKPELALAETQFAVPRLGAPATYTPSNGVVDIELSEYPGYAGLIVANGGLEPNDNSIFARKYGFKVRIKLSEEESWASLNAGRMAASATTVDVLAVYGKQFQVTVPAQIGYSRGADGLVVHNNIRRINDLKGKVLATSQFTESDFFIRYLAQEAGLKVHMLANLREAPMKDQVNLVYADDSFVACDHFLTDIHGASPSLAGCITWAPKTSEAVTESKGKATLLTTNKNLLIIADVLIVNKGFAQAAPAMVKGLVAGLLEGNQMVRTNPNPHLALIGAAFHWDAEKTRTEMAKVHLSNGPENLAFFSGAIDAAGSFGGIFQSANLAYGPELIRDPMDGERFVNLDALNALQKEGLFQGQRVDIAPIRSGTGAPVENDPLLSKNIRFQFEPNSAKLELQNPENLRNLAGLANLLKVSPGSSLVLRGHVDNSKLEDFKKQGVVREMSLRAIDFSKQRASEIKRLLVEREKVDVARLDIIGRGWEEPQATHDESRRVEALWFTLE